MPVICRLIQVLPAAATKLAADTSQLASTIEAAKIYSDVYRYWHGIDWLLAAHGHSHTILKAGQAVSQADGPTPASRLLQPAEVARLNDALKNIEPDALAPHYDAAALDQAGIYPREWVEWEETFDPLGQVLEHYHFLREFAANRAKAGDGMLFFFEMKRDGTV